MLPSRQKIMAGGTIAPPAIKFLVFLGHDKNKNSVTYNDMNEGM